MFCSSPSLDDTSTAVPSALPTPTSGAADEFQNQISPTLRKNQFKKAKADEMDK